MKETYIRSSDGKYFVEGKGFVATSKEGATKFATADEAKAKQVCAASLGILSALDTGVSYAVVYVRKNDAWNGSSLTKSSPKSDQNQFDPSKRRFATFEEARIHGSRFHTRRANKADAIGSGTAGHKGFFIVETTDPVNSAVNPNSGLTNSI